MKGTVENKGIITLGEKVMVSDPCYGLGTWCQGVLKNVLPGQYDCNVEYSDEGSWGTRVSAIEVTHVNYKASFLLLQMEDFEVGVDSGQAGIFDYEYYAKYHMDATERPHVNDDWYDMVCDLTSGYVTNPNYVSFLDLPEYKASILSFRSELDKLKEKYPELDVDSTYMELINHYHELENPKEIDLGSLTETLRFLKSILNGTYEETERTEGEKALTSIENKFSLMLNKFYAEYRHNINSEKKLYRNTGNTIDGLGFVSSSGYGDGGYNCFTAKNSDGKIVSIRVEFIGEYDEEEDEYEEI